MSYRVISCAAITIALASNAAAQQVDCKDAVSFALSTAPLIDTINAMTEICKDIVQTDQTCQKYARVLNENSTAEGMVVFAVKSMAIAIKCPNE